MRVDAATGTEVVLRRAGVELVAAQCIRTRINNNAVKLSRDGNRTAHPAIGAGAAARCAQAIGQLDPKLHGSAVTSAPVLSFSCFQA
jgi:hypothetical protein